MNEEILKLAKECGFDQWHGTDDVEFLKVIEAFYRAAYNKAIEDAAKQCELWIDRYSNTVITNEGHYKSRMDADECAAAIRALEMK